MPFNKEIQTLSLSLSLSLYLMEWTMSDNQHQIRRLISWLFMFYGISNFVGYLRQNLFLCK